MQTTIPLLLPLTLLAAAAVTNAFLLDGILWGSSTSRNRLSTTEVTPNPQPSDTYPPDLQSSTLSGDDNTLTGDTTQVPDNTTEVDNNSTTQSYYHTPDQDNSTDAAGSSGSVTESSVHWPTLTSPGYSTDCEEGTTSAHDTFATTPPPSASTHELPRSTGMGNPCEFTGPLREQILVVYNFTQTSDFRLLSENQQLFVYEILAAAEGCQLSQFLTVPAIQRFLLLTQDLPLKFVNRFIVFLFKSLAAEGINVPV